MICTALALLLMQGVAPPMHAIASTTSDSRLPQDSICRDEALLRRDVNDQWPRVHTSQHAWMSFVGDLDADGLFDYPAGIDAVSLSTAGLSHAPTLLDCWFSSDRDFNGFKDGDILKISALGGVEVVHTEGELDALLQPTSGNVDIDALAFLGSSILRLSFANNLSGTILGNILDGAILEWDTSANTIVMIASEADVQQWVDQAVVGASSIGDLKSLTMLPGTTAMAFTVQAPTSDDASVYTNDGGGKMVTGWQEADWQFQQSTELDALCFVSGEFEQPVVLSTDVAYVQQGEAVKLRMRHAEPGHQLAGIAGKAFHLQPHWRGQSGLAVVDPLLGPSRSWPAASQMDIFADSSGAAGYVAVMPNLPVGVSSVNIWLQALDLDGHGWSSPVVLRLE
ncbi:MAG: hypothetical protein GY747_09655 [Planctomycetes bacterium]|nr:hypothetical protein [Planctomycetota bacterium]MCP4771658.1 hypothetical protein [Planctomycetota bacterium]MCP4860042.1 hypothetical protein [Planctomycetota bacterium]